MISNMNTMCSMLERKVLVEKVRLELWPEGSKQVSHVNVWGNVFQARGASSFFPLLPQDLCAEGPVAEEGKMKKLEVQEHHEQVIGNDVREITEDLFM